MNDSGSRLPRATAVQRIQRQSLAVVQRSRPLQRAEEEHGAFEGRIPRERMNQRGAASCWIRSNVGAGMLTGTVRMSAVKPGPGGRSELIPVYQNPPFHHLEVHLQKNRHLASENKNCTRIFARNLFRKSSLQQNDKL